MIRNPYFRYCAPAAMAIAVAALMLSGGCKKKDGGDDFEKMITQESHDLVMIQSKNGLKKYLFETPLMEFYEFAAEPYREFRKGIYVETYQDSTEVIESVLKADYALFYVQQELWFASGNVIAESRINERTLYTEQLFWNQHTGRVYSFVDGLFVDNQGLPTRVKGFEADEQFTDIDAISYDGVIPMESTPKERAERPSRDSLPAERPSETIPERRIVTDNNNPLANRPNANLQPIMRDPNEKEAIRSTPQSRLQTDRDRRNSK